MRYATFNIKLSGGKQLDADRLAEHIRHYFDAQRKGFFNDLAASFGPPDKAPLWAMEFVKSCSTIQIQAKSAADQIALTLSSAELASHFSLSHDDTMALWLNKMCAEAWPERTFELALDSPGFAAWHDAQELLPPLVVDTTQVRRSRDSIFRILRIGMITACVFAVLIPAISAYTIYRNVQARVDQVNGIVTELTNTVKSQGARLEGLYEAGADALDWTGVKDKVSGWIGGDSTKAE